MRFVFWAAAAVIVYTYAGYAAWLWLRARLRPWPVLRAEHLPPVSIVMVVRNEERWLEGKLRNLLALDYPQERCQIVVVSDGSTDRTDTILRAHANHPRVQVIMNQLSRGKACGLNDAISVAAGEVIVFTDARQQLEKDVRRLGGEGVVVRQMDMRVHERECPIQEHGKDHIVEATIVGTAMVRFASVAKPPPPLVILSLDPQRRQAARVRLGP